MKNFNILGLVLSVIMFPAFVSARSEPSVKRVYAHACTQDFLKCLDLFVTEVGPTPLDVDFDRLETDATYCGLMLRECRYFVNRAPIEID